MRKFNILLLLATGFVVIVSKLQDPYAINTSNSLLGMTGEHMLGTDYLGRDLLSRIVYGTWTSLRISLISLGLVVLLSCVLGGIAGIFGGWIDAGITIVTDILVSIPSLILSLVFVGLFSNSLLSVMLALVIS